MRTMQCPKCPLRFSTRSGLLCHLRQDHRRTTGLGLPDRLCPPPTGTWGRSPSSRASCRACSRMPEAADSAPASRARIGSSSPAASAARSMSTPAPPAPQPRRAGRPEPPQEVRRPRHRRLLITSVDTPMVLAAAGWAIEANAHHPRDLRP
jgi:hypothetical protein